MRQDFDDVMGFLRSKTDVDRPGFWARLGRAAETIIVTPFTYIPHTLASLTFVYPLLVGYIALFMGTIQGHWNFYENLFIAVSIAGFALIAFNAVLSMFMSDDAGETLVVLSLFAIGLPALIFFVRVCGHLFPR